MYSCVGRKREKKDNDDVYGESEFRNPILFSLEKLFLQRYLFRFGTLWCNALIGKILQNITAYKINSSTKRKLFKRQKI